MLKALSKSFQLTVLLFIAVGYILSSGCAKSKPAESKSPLPVLDQKRIDDQKRIAEIANAGGTPDFSPPRPAEVNTAVRRVFKDAVIIEDSRDPYFIAGDFNGDLSADLAVVVKPDQRKLSEINHELANWILVDPVRLAMLSQKVTPRPDMHVEMEKRRRVQVDVGDVLLAVIHGFAAKGWRDSYATQTYVLKGAAGGKMKTEARKNVVNAKNKEKLPQLVGDVIAETIGEQSGFLYYNGAKYAWYDPQTYKPALPVRSGHGMASAAMR